MPNNINQTPNDYKKDKIKIKMACSPNEAYFVVRDNKFPENELTDFQKNKDKEFEITNNNNETIKAKGDEIIKLPDGTLTTMYHYMKNSETKIEEIIESEKFQKAE